MVRHEVVPTTCTTIREFLHSTMLSFLSQVDPDHLLNYFTIL